MEKKSLVSIIIPVYNVEKFVKKSILSAMNQTYQNLEIVVVNDGSTAKDIIDLIEHIKQTVYEKTGKKIELEVEIIGE